MIPMSRVHQWSSVPSAAGSISRLMHRVEVEAWAQMQLALPADFTARMGISVTRTGGGVALMARNVDNLALNRLLGLGLDEPLDASLLGDLIARYRDAGVSRLLVQWSPDASPDDMPIRLRSLGFRAIPRIAKLCRRPDSHAEAPTSVTVRTIDVDEAAAFAATAGCVERPELAPGFSSTVGHPGWHHYLAMHGARAVAAAALFVRDEIAWFGLGVTLPADRGRGAHSALLARRLRDAAALGCNWAACETTEETPERPNPSFRNMRRAGFEVVCLGENYVLDLAARG